MKILFLDIDGVMNTRSHILRDGMHAIGEEFLDRLKIIVEETGAEIVLSSTWRIAPDNHRRVVEALKTRGLKLKGKTPAIDGKFSQPTPRCKEIALWLKRHPQVTKFAIVDDWQEAGWEFEENFFQTSFEDGGLTEEITQKIVRWLNA